MAFECTSWHSAPMDGVLLLLRPIASTMLALIANYACRTADVRPMYRPLISRYLLQLLALSERGR